MQSKARNGEIHAAVSDSSPILALQHLLSYDVAEEGLWIAYSSSEDVPAHKFPVPGAHVIAQAPLLIGPCDC